MARSNPELWQRLAAFEPSPPGKMFSFARRLARENGWSLDFARRALEEYRRFLYLSGIVGPRLTASEAVERVWQLHLGYPASYGRALCREVLGRRLRYQRHEGAEREAGYRATLAAYEQEFDSSPPVEIWPDPERRAAGATAPANEPQRAERTAHQLPALPLMPAGRPA